MLSLSRNLDKNPFIITCEPFLFEELMLNKRPLSCAFLILLLSSTLLWGLSLVLLLSARADVDWSLQVVDEKATLQGVSLAVDSAGNPHIVYSDRSDTGLIVMKYASLTGTNWSIQTVDNGSAGSLALDSADNPHIAYSGTSSELKYASWNGQNWEIQTVDPAPNRPKTSPGACTSLQYLALDANDRPFIVYDVNTDVKLATKETSGWTVQTVISNEASAWETWFWIPVATHVSFIF
jgi:hypothetical protein